MPFTFSHPAIVLPLKYLPDTSISMTGLIIGSMTPDFEYFIRMRVESIYSHTISGLFWFDIPLGLILTILYISLVKNPLITHLPKIFQTRFSAFINTANKRYSIRYLTIICLSVFIGASSHIFWDGFTHPTGVFVAVIPQLSNTVSILHHTFYIYKLLQHSSSIIGGIVIFFAIFSLPKRQFFHTGNIIPFWIFIGCMAIFTTVIRAYFTASFTQPGNWIVTAISGGFIGLLIISINYRITLKAR